MRGWNKPQLVLGLVKFDTNRYPKEFVELYSYINSKQNSYEQIFTWLESMLRQKLITDYEQESQKKNFDLKLFYFQNNTKTLPLYYSAMSVKYNRRAKFYLIKNNQVKNCDQLKSTSNRQLTPIYILIDNKYCYNYGSNLNELPNFVYLNQLLLFLHPDMNSIFQISFFS